MERTCHFRHGNSDEYNKADLRRCSACQKVYYCSSDCQKYDWVVHIFDCKPKRPINTADYLALAVHKSLFPEHPQTCKDYGFDRAITAEEKTNLFGLYIGLIRYLEIAPKTIHNWRVRGVLVDEIKVAFYKLPESSRGGYFPWFLQNEHIVALAGQPPPAEKLHDLGDAMAMRAWRATGGSERDSPEDIRAAIARKPEEEQACHGLYTLLLSNMYPSPSLDIWIRFGFAVCKCQEDEMDFSSQYQRLISMCTFKEFCDAYRSRRLLDFFHSRGIQSNLNEAHLRDLLHGPINGNKSVWNLKQFIAQEGSSTDEFNMAPSVKVDYRFFNCRNNSERRQLKRVYKEFFYNHDGDPLALHEAAIKGNTHGFLSKVVQGLQDPKFQWLMKNPYPLPDL